MRRFMLHPYIPATRDEWRDRYGRMSARQAGIALSHCIDWQATLMTAHNDAVKSSGCCANNPMTVAMRCHKRSRTALTSLDAGLASMCHSTWLIHVISPVSVTYTFLLNRISVTCRLEWCFITGSQTALNGRVLIPEMDPINIAIIPPRSSRLWNYELLWCRYFVGVCQVKGQPKRFSDVCGQCGGGIFQEAGILVDSDASSREGSALILDCKPLD
jgi:hypothetical protein